MNPQDGNFFPVMLSFADLLRQFVWGFFFWGGGSYLAVFSFQVLGFFLVGTIICLLSVNVNHHKSPVLHPNTTWIQILESNAALTTRSEGWNPYCPKPTWLGTDFGIWMPEICSADFHAEKKRRLLPSLTAEPFHGHHCIRSEGLAVLSGTMLMATFVFIMTKNKSVFPSAAWTLEHSMPICNRRKQKDTWDSWTMHKKN